MALPNISYQDFYDQAAIEACGEGLAAARPDLVEVRELCRTPGGRRLLLLAITDRATGAADDKPAYLVHANIHCHELSTTTAALYLARELVAGHGADEVITDLLRRVAFYIIPRVTPDGAEWALKTNGSVRSRNHPQPAPNGLSQADLDGDGRINWLRWLDPEGDQVPLAADPRLLVSRQPTDVGPYYRQIAEGAIADYDGGPVHVAERRVDFNRQWPAFWEPEHVQGGAGDYPLSEPEMQAIGQFLIEHRNIYGMLGFHTGGNGVLRPSATRNDDELDREDVKLMREVGQVGAELTGFQLFSVREYCRTYSVDAKLRGHFTDWAYSHLGALAFEIELGNLYNSAGITTDQWQQATPAEREAFGAQVLRWSDETGYDAFVPWRPFEHPQLGPVEIGGWVRSKLANPALGHLDPICAGCAKFILHVAGLAPRLALRCEQATWPGGVHRLRATVVNEGALPTNVVREALRLRGIDGVTAQLELGDGVELLSRTAVHRLGHLAPVRGKRDLEWFVRAPAGGQVTVTATCPRAGRVSQTVVLPA